MNRPGVAGIRFVFDERSERELEIMWFLFRSTHCLLSSYFESEQTKYIVEIQQGQLFHLASEQGKPIVGLRFT